MKTAILGIFVIIAIIIRITASCRQPSCLTNKAIKTYKKWAETYDNLYRNVHPAYNSNDIAAAFAPNRTICTARVFALGGPPYGNSISRDFDKLPNRSLRARWKGSRVGTVISRRVVQGDVRECEVA